MVLATIMRYKFLLTIFKKNIKNGKLLLRSKTLTLK